MTPASKFTPAPKSGLVGDQRGAIVLMAVFMSAFLVGGLWYIMGIGDALVYRQTVQAGADSTAFTGAVYHARGMNIIAMVNIVIGAVVAIAAAAGFLMHIASMVISVATTMCEMSQQPPITFTLPDGSTETIDYSQFAFACDTIKPAKDLMVKLQTVITKVKADTDSMLISLSTSQKEVARTAPWVGSAQSSVVADQHAPFLEGGGTARGVATGRRGAASTMARASAGAAESLEPARRGAATRRDVEARVNGSLSRMREREGNFSHLPTSSS